MSSHTPRGVNGKDKSCNKFVVFIVVLCSETLQASSIRLLSFIKLCSIKKFKSNTYTHTHTYKEQAAEKGKKESKKKERKKSMKEVKLKKWKSAATTKKSYKNRNYFWCTSKATMNRCKFYYLFMASMCWLKCVCCWKLDNKNLFYTNQDVVYECPLNSMCRCASPPNETRLLEINCNEVSLYKFPGKSKICAHLHS